MEKRKIDLEQWCKINDRGYLLSEWDYEKNSMLPFPMLPSTTEYCTPIGVWWRCSKGHEWRAPVLKRTSYGLGCPVCTPDQKYLPIHTKLGCLSIIGIAPENKNKRFYEDSQPRYICRCDCGKELVLSEFDFIKKKHRFCTNSIRRNRSDKLFFAEYDRSVQCGLKTLQEEKKWKTYQRIGDPSRKKDFTGIIHESLEILECIDNHYEKLGYIVDGRKNAGGVFYVYKLYRCRCYLCGKEQNIKSSDFTINAPTEYGLTAYNGYWSNAHCDCHPISSFQWIVTKILKENGIPYRVEVSFPDLFGTRHKKPLRYDFGVYNEDGSIRCLIECQGEQHYKPIEDFGGEATLKRQQANDELKRKYAEAKGIPLYEIPYTEKKYEKIQNYLLKLINPDLHG